MSPLSLWFESLDALPFVPGDRVCPPITAPNAPLYTRPPPHGQSHYDRASALHDDIIAADGIFLLPLLHYPITLP